MNPLERTFAELWGQVVAMLTGVLGDLELGRHAEARTAYHRALALAGDGAERRLLERRLALLELSDPR